MNESFENDATTSSACSDIRYSASTSIILAAAVGFVALITIFGNALVVASFATDRKLRSFGNYFILNLAVSDLVVGLLIAAYAPYVVLGCWHLTSTGCRIFLLLDYICPLASSWNMAMISLDRYWSVTRPVTYRRVTGTMSGGVTAPTGHPPTTALALMTVPWLVGAAWYTPTMLFWSEITGINYTGNADDHNQPPYHCQVEFYYHVGYLIASSCVEFLSPFATVATINLLIYVNIRRRSRGLLMMSSSHNPTASGFVKRQLERDKRSARSLAFLVVAFLITWGPYQICAFVNPVCGFCIPDPVFDVAFWLLWINSAVNPAIYPFFQRRFRVVFAAILKCQTTEMLRHSSAPGSDGSRDNINNRRSRGQSLQFPSDSAVLQPKENVSKV